MSERNIFHALGLHMHQPPGNLHLLIDANPWDAAQIVRCYERAARYVLQYRDVAILHVAFSGVLLDQLQDPELIERYRPIADLNAVLDLYRQADNIELLGTGHYHPIFPLIPPADWTDQLIQGRISVERVFGRAPRGFLPPEMAFTMEMIPALVRAGYEYVVVDGVHVRPEDGISDVFRPYLACHDGVCIDVVARDRSLSDAQESGLDSDWFARETTRRVNSSARPREQRLLTTWSSGENGGWFRQAHEESGFFGHFFAPFMDRCRNAGYPVQPIRLSEYLDRVRPMTHASVQTGAWNVGASSGEDLSLWGGTVRQQAAVAEVSRLSGLYWNLKACRAAIPAPIAASIEQARRLILEAETSCFLFWGDAWIPHLYARTQAASRLLDEAQLEIKALCAQQRSEPLKRSGDV